MTPQPTFRPVTRRLLTAVGIVATAVLGLLLLLWFGAPVFLLVFASLLLAIFLSRVSGVLSQHTPDFSVPLAG